MITKGQVWGWWCGWTVLSLGSPLAELKPNFSGTRCDLFQPIVLWIFFGGICWNQELKWAERNQISISFSDAMFIQLHEFQLGRPIMSFSRNRICSGRWKQRCEHWSSTIPECSCWPGGSEDRTSAVRISVSFFGAFLGPKVLILPSGKPT